MAEYTEQQLKDAARRALEDGNVESARRLIAAAREAASAAESSGVPEDMFYNPRTGQYTSRELLRNANEGGSVGRAAALGAAQGGTFNYGDELAGLYGALRYGPDGRRYATELSRASNEAAQRDAPTAYTAGQVGGAIGQALTTAPLAAAQTIGGMVGRGGLLGMVEGALHGSGRGETPDERQELAIKEGRTGAVVGAAAPLAVATATRAARAPSALWNNVVNRPDQSRATRALVQTFDRSRRSPDDVAQALRQAQELGVTDYTVADALGDAGARRLSGITRSTDDAASEITEWLEGRASDSARRISQFTEEAFETGGDTAQRRLAALEAARNARADELGPIIRQNASPVNVQPVLDAIDARMGNLPDTGVDLGGIANRIMAYRQRLAASNSRLIDFNVVYDVFDDLNDDISVAFRAGRNKEASRLIEVKRALEGAMEKASEGFKAMNAELSEMHRLEDALATGQALSRPGARAADVQDQFERLTPPQQAQARVGYADRPLTRIENNRAQAPDVAREFLSPRGREDIGTLVPQSDRFLQQLQLERNMFNTQNKAIKGSQTANNLAEQVDAEGASRGLVSAARSTLNFNMGDAIAALLNAASDRASGINNETRALIGRALLSRDADVLIDTIQKAKMAETTRQALLSAIVRQGVTSSSRPEQETRQLPAR